LQAARTALARSKRIIALKLGHSETGRALVWVRSGSLAGEDRLYDAHFAHRASWRRTTSTRCWKPPRCSAIAVAARFGFPVVLKGIAPHLPHKTELGLVRLGLRGATEVAYAFAALQSMAPRVWS